MKNTEFEAMNIEELDLVTGGLSFGQLVYNVKEIGNVAINIGKGVVNKVKSWTE